MVSLQENLVHFPSKDWDANNTILSIKPLKQDYEGYKSLQHDESKPMGNHPPSNFFMKHSKIRMAVSINELNIRKLNLFLIFNNTLIELED